MVTYKNKKSKLIVYTRKTNEKSYPNGLTRSIHFAVSRDGIHRIHFDVHGMPRFDLSAERDLNPSLSEVSIQVILSNGEGGVLKDEDIKLYTNAERR